MGKFQKLLEEKKKEMKAKGKKSQTMTSSYSGDEKKKRLYGEMIKKANIPYRYMNKNFANYNIKPENKRAYGKIGSYLNNYDEISKEGKWFVMMGDYGTGKTHLAIAMLKKICYMIAGQAVEKYGDMPLTIIRGKISMQPVYFVKAPELLEEIKSAYEYDDVLESDVIAKYKYKKFLVIDDLGTEKPSKWQQEKLYSILDYRYSNLKPTVITTNCSFEDLIENMGQRVVDRIQEAARDYITGWRGESYRVKEGGQ